RVARYEDRRNRVVDALRGKLASEPRCEGTFFVWLQLPPEVTTERLLTEHGVAVAPGEGFGPHGAGWARISLAVSDAVLDAGLGRVPAALAGEFPVRGRVPRDARTGRRPRVRSYVEGGRVDRHERKRLVDEALDRRHALRRIAAQRPL